MTQRLRNAGIEACNPRLSVVWVHPATDGVLSPLLSVPGCSPALATRKSPKTQPLPSHSAGPRCQGQSQLWHACPPSADNLTRGREQTTLPDLCLFLCKRRLMIMPSSWTVPGSSELPWGGQPTGSSGAHLQTTHKYCDDWCKDAGWP